VRGVFTAVKGCVGLPTSKDFRPGYRLDAKGRQGAEDDRICFASASVSQLGFCHCSISQDLADKSRHAHSAEIAAKILGGAIDDYLKFIASRFLKRTFRDREEVLRAFSEDHRWTIARSGFIQAEHHLNCSSRIANESV
jgi:hypothetical protein